MRFEGNNPYNNRVYVNFKKKTVNFELVMGGMTLIKVYTMFFFLLLLIFSFLSIPLFIFVEIDNSLRVILIIPLIFAVITSLIFWNKKWRKEKYPIANSKLVNIFRRMISFNMIKPKKLKIEPHSLFLGKYLYIPKFSNVCLIYGLVGDFAEQIKSIKIDNLYKDEAFGWYCVFEFNNKPENGYLEIEYI